MVTISHQFWLISMLIQEILETFCRCDIARNNVSIFLGLDVLCFWGTSMSPKTGDAFIISCAVFSLNTVSFLSQANDTLLVLVFIFMLSYLTYILYNTVYIYILIYVYKVYSGWIPMLIQGFNHFSVLLQDGFSRLAMTSIRCQDVLFQGLQYALRCLEKWEGSGGSSEKNVFPKVGNVRINPEIFKGVAYI